MHPRGSLERRITQIALLMLNTSFRQSFVGHGHKSKLSLLQGYTTKYIFCFCHSFSVFSFFFSHIFLPFSDIMLNVVCLQCILVIILPNIDLVFVTVPYYCFNTCLFNFFYNLVKLYVSSIKCI